MKLIFNTKPVTFVILVIFAVSLGTFISTVLPTILTTINIIDRTLYAFLSNFFMVIFTLIMYKIFSGKNIFLKEKVTYKDMIQNLNLK